MSDVPADALTVLANREASPKIASTGAKSWLMLQPNSGGIQNFRAAFESVAREILSKNLTPEAGDHVGMSVTPTLVQDVTKDALDFWGGDMWRCVPKHAGNKGQSLYRPTAVVDGGVAEDSYTVDANGDLTAGLLIYARGFANAANNGLKVVVATSAAGAIKVATGTLVAEAVAPANATLDVVGVQGAAGDYQFDASGDLICTAGNFTAMGLSAGQIIKIGGATAATQFATAAYNGWAEVDPTRAITATKLPLRNRSWTVGAADTGAAKTIQVLFSRFYRNYPLLNALFSKATSQLELEQVGAGAAGASSFRYLKGLRVGSATLAAPLKGKMELTLAFVGMDVPDPVLQADRPADTATALEPLAVDMFDTTLDIKHEMVAKAADNTPLVAEIESWTFSQALTLKAKEIHGVMGASGHLDGRILPSLSVDAYLSSDDIPKAIRANTTVRFISVAQNTDGGFALHIPAGKLRNDEETAQLGEGVMVSVEVEANREAASGIASSLSVFGYLP